MQREPNTNTAESAHSTAVLSGTITPSSVQNTFTPQYPGGTKLTPPRNSWGVSPSISSAHYSGGLPSVSELSSPQYSGGVSRITFTQHSGGGSVSSPPHPLRSTEDTPCSTDHCSGSMTPVIRPSNSWPMSMRHTVTSSVGHMTHVVTSHDLLSSTSHRTLRNPTTSSPRTSTSTRHHLLPSPLLSTSGDHMSSHDHHVTSYSHNMASHNQLSNYHRMTSHDHRMTSHDHRMTSHDNRMTSRDYHMTSYDLVSASHTIFPSHGTRSTSRSEVKSSQHTNFQTTSPTKTFSVGTTYVSVSHFELYITESSSVLTSLHVSTSAQPVGDISTPFSSASVQSVIPSHLTASNTKFTRSVSNSKLATISKSILDSKSFTNSRFVSGSRHSSHSSRTMTANFNPALSNTASKSSEDIVTIPSQQPHSFHERSTTSSSPRPTAMPPTGPPGNSGFNYKLILYVVPPLGVVLLCVVCVTMVLCCRKYKR